MFTSDTYKLTTEMRNKLKEIGKGFKFSVYVKHLDLVYNGEFESLLFTLNENNTLEEIVNTLLSTL